MPDQVHVVVTARGNPPLPLGRLRAAGELQELRTDDLAFDDDEIAQVLAGAALGRLGAESVAAGAAHRGLAGRGRAGRGLARRSRWGRRRFRRRVHRHRPLRAGLPRHRGPRPGSRPSCGSSCCAPPSCGGSRPSPARPAPAAPTRRLCWTGRSAAGSSSMLSIPGAGGSATTACSGTCCGTSWPSPSRSWCRPCTAERPHGRPRPARSTRRSRTTSPQGMSPRPPSWSPDAGTSGSTPAAWAPSPRGWMRCRTALVRADPRLCTARAWLLLDLGRLDEVDEWLAAGDGAAAGRLTGAA